MFNFFKSKEQRLFDGCDFDLATKVFINMFKGKPIPNALANLLDGYISSPCSKTAFEIVKKYPDLMVCFEQCKPGGLYTRIGVPAKNK